MPEPSAPSEPGASSTKPPDRSGRIKQQVTKRVLKALAGELAENEELKVCLFCQKYVSVLVAMLGLIPYYLIAVPLYVVADDMRVFLLKGNFFGSRIDLLFSDDLGHFDLGHAPKGSR